MISNAQIDALDSRVLDQFSRDLALRLADELPEWAQSGTGDARNAQVTGIVRYGRELKIIESEALYRFTVAMIRFRLGIPLSRTLAGEFRAPGISRVAQVENFMLRLLSNRDAKAVVTL